MQPPEPGLQLIRQFEGFRSTPYRDVAGIWTVGIGSIRGLDGQPITAFSPAITAEQAEALLARDVARTWAGVQKLLVCCRLTPGQWGALLSFAYNLGLGSLQASSLRQAILAGVRPVEDEWTRWCLAGRPLVKSTGLLRRRQAEWALFTTG